MMQILLMKLIDLLDDPNDEDKLIVRDFRTSSLTPATLKQEEYIEAVDRHLEKLNPATILAEKILADARVRAKKAEALKLKMLKGSAT